MAQAFAEGYNITFCPIDKPSQDQAGMPAFFGEPVRIGLVASVSYPGWNGNAYPLLNAGRPTVGQWIIECSRILRSGNPKLIGDIRVSSKPSSETQKSAAKLALENNILPIDLDLESVPVIHQNPFGVDPQNYKMDFDLTLDPDSSGFIWDTIAYYFNGEFIEEVSAEEIRTTPQGNFVARVTVDLQKIDPIIGFVPNISSGTDRFYGAIQFVAKGFNGTDLLETPRFSSPNFEIRFDGKQIRSTTNERCEMYSGQISMFGDYEVSNFIYSMLSFGNTFLKCNDAGLPFGGLSPIFRHIGEGHQRGRGLDIRYFNISSSQQNLYDGSSTVTIGGVRLVDEPAGQRLLDIATIISPNFSEQDKETAKNRFSNWVLQNRIPLYKSFY